MKPSPEKYAALPAKSQMGPINIPGAYCQGCGATMALYSYSMIQPEGYDENDKAFYKTCPECPPKPKL
jgi:hypothetical protein